MARLTPAHRRSRTKFPPQVSRAADPAAMAGEIGSIESAGRMAGGGGAGGASPLRYWWQGPPRRELRGVAVGGRISQRLCAII